MSVKMSRSAGIDPLSSAALYLENGVGVRESKDESVEDAAMAMLASSRGGSFHMAK